MRGSPQSCRQPAQGTASAGESRCAVNDVSVSADRYVYLAYMAIISKLHVLSKIQAFDGGDVSQIEKPNVCQDLAFEDKPSHNTTQDVNVDLQIGSGVYQSQLEIVSVRYLIEKLQGR